MLNWFLVYWQQVIKIIHSYSYSYPGQRVRCGFISGSAGSVCGIASAQHSGMEDIYSVLIQAICRLNYHFSLLLVLLKRGETHNGDALKEPFQQTEAERFSRGLGPGSSFAYTLAYLFQGLDNRALRWRIHSNLSIIFIIRNLRTK
jgi:hypothetical protein